MADMTATEWAALVLQDLGVPASANNMQFMSQWMLSENPAANWAPRNNPLNNGLGSGGGSGLGSYADLTTAAQEVANNLKTGNPAYGYGAVVTALQQSAPPTQTAQAIVASSWAGGHYNNGKNWAGGAVTDTGAATAGTAPGTASTSPTAPAPSDSVTIDGKTYTTPGGDANAAAQTSALSTMAATLSNYGFSGGDLQTLTSWAWGELTSNTDPSQIAIDIQTPGSAVYPIFEKQFPGFTAANQQLTSQGLQAVSVQEYQSYQTQATQMAQAAGLPPGFLNKENIGILVGGNVSSTELSNRLTDATTLAVNSTPEQQAMFNNYFGLNYNQSILSSDPMAFGQGANFAPTGHGPLTPGQIAALALDPNVAEPLIKQQIAAAQIGGAGATAGIGSISAATATQLAQAGISPSQATSAFQNLAVYAPLEAARPGMGGEASQGVVSPDQLATGQLLGNPAAERQLQTAIEVGKAPFSGGGGFVQNAKGATGTGSASSTGAGNT